MKFGEKVRDLRKKHSLTQDELAQCLGINKRTIIGWERDGRYPRSIEMLEKMADIFHVPLTYLQPDQSLFSTRLMKPCLHLVSPKCENSTMEKMYF